MFPSDPPSLPEQASAGGLTNACRILENLWLGGQEAAGDKSSLLREGVSHIVNCTRRLINLYPDDFHYHRVNWADDTGQVRRARVRSPPSGGRGQACRVQSDPVLSLPGWLSVVLLGLLLIFSQGRQGGCPRQSASCTGIPRGVRERPRGRWAM